MIETPSHVAIAAAVVIGVGAIAGCSSSEPAAAPPASTTAVGKPAVSTLVFTSRDEPGNLALEDLGVKSAPGGADLGDVVAFTKTLLRDNRPVGQVHVAAVGVDHTRHLSEATGTFALSDGSIQVAGIVAMTPKFTLAVTGGTGAYAGDTGTMDFDGSSRAEKMTIHLTQRAGS